MAPAAIAPIVNLPPKAFAAPPPKLLNPFSLLPKNPIFLASAILAAACGFLAALAAKLSAAVLAVLPPSVALILASIDLVPLF